ncbi:MAG: tetratricopeptide repeat protein [bacterium]
MPAAFAVALVLGFLLLRPALFEEAVVSDPQPIAVISFENLTGDTTYNYLQKAIPNLLITNLEQSGYFRVTTWERMHDLLKQLGKDDVEVIDRDLGFELCRMDGTSTVVVGSFTKAGEVFASDVKVLDVASKSILKSASAKGEGVTSILHSQIDALSREISRGLDLAERRIKASQLHIAEVTTTSMEAYNYFVRGKEEYNMINDIDAAIFFKKAVQIDSTFAAAYLYLSQALHRGPASEKEAIAALEKAKDYSDRATEKERLLIEALYAIAIEKDRDRYFQTLKKITILYPNEKEAHHDLGKYYFNSGEMRQSIEHFSKALELDPTYGKSLNMLGYAYFYHYYWLGNLEKSLSAAQQAAVAFKEAGGAEWIPIFLDQTLGWIYYDREEYELSRNYYESWYNTQKEWRPERLPSIKATYNFYCGLIDLKQGQLDSAKGKVTEILSLLPEVDPSRQDQAKFYYDLLHGEILLAENAIDKTIEIGENISPLMLSIPLDIVHSFFNNLPQRDFLARAYHQNGEFDKAIAEYERLTSLDPNSRGRYFIHPRYYYRLGKLYEEKGLREEAMRKYEMVLEIWHDGDADLPALLDAKVRYARLKGE